MLRSIELGLIRNNLNKVGHSLLQRLIARLAMAVGIKRSVPRLLISKIRMLQLMLLPIGIRVINTGIIISFCRRLIKRCFCDRQTRRIV